MRKASPYGLALMRGVFWILGIEAMLSALLNQGRHRGFASKPVKWIVSKTEHRDKIPVPAEFQL